MTFKGETIRYAVPIPSGIKEKLRGQPAVRALWTAYRERQGVADYRSRREHYARVAQERGLVYDVERTTAEVRSRLAARGYTPPKHERGSIHTFAVVAQYSWHRHLLPDLRELGPLSLFDFVAEGFSVEALSRSDDRSAAQREEMNARILPALRAAHAERPVDWVFFYGGGHEYGPELIRAITSELGIPVVNMSLDDKQGWAGRAARGVRSGTVDVTSSFDLFATSARVACEWHMAEGGRPLYLPEGFDASAYRPANVERDLPVSFVGVAYGFRLSVDAFLRKHGVDFHPFGTGWPGGKVDDAIAIFNRSVINLGMGGFDYSEELTNVKGRDFEIPGTGGGVYLTSYNADLAQHFVIGEEILCYRGRDEMLELIRYYLSHREEAAGIARRARERSLREHRWLHRYERILGVLGILESN